MVVTDEEIGRLCIQVAVVTTDHRVGDRDHAFDLAVDAGGDSFVAFVLDLAAGGAGAGGDATAGCGFSDSTDGVGNSADTACDCSWSATGRGRGKRWQWVVSA